MRFTTLFFSLFYWKNSIELAFYRNVPFVVVGDYRKRCAGDEALCGMSIQYCNWYCG